MTTARGCDGGRCWPPAAPPSAGGPEIPASHDSQRSNCPMAPYPALHFFLDESGDLARPAGSGPARPALVGGVMLFGPYGPQDDDHLRNLLRQALARAGGRFPADLHFVPSRLSHAQREALFKDLAAGLTAWACADHAAAGVALVHVGDVFTSGPTLLTERAYDNRYIAMTWALIE